MDVLSAAFSS